MSSSRRPLWFGNRRRHHVPAGPASFESWDVGERADESFWYGETALLKGDNIDIAILIFTDDFWRFPLPCWRNPHEEEGQLGGMFGVEAFDLTDGQVEETHPVASLQWRFWTDTSHCRSQSTNLTWSTANLLRFGSIGGVKNRNYYKLASLIECMGPTSSLPGSWTFDQSSGPSDWQRK